MNSDGVVNQKFIINLADYMLPKPSKKHCKRKLYEEGKELPIITVEIGVLE